MHSNLQLIIKGKVSWHACLWWPCVVYGGVYDSSRTLHGKYCANSVSDHNIRTQITYYLYPPDIILQEILVRFLRLGIQLILLNR